MDLLNPKLSYLQLEAVPRKRHGSAKETVWIASLLTVYLDYTYYINILEDAYGC